MKELLAKLSPREQGLLAGGCAVLLLFAIYGFIYQPLLDEQKKLAVAIENQQQIKVFLASVSQEAAQLRQNQTETPEGNGEPSAIAAIDTSSAQMGLKPCIKRVAPEDANNTSVWLEKCGFDQLASWLVALQKKQGLAVRQIQLNREQTTGLASGKIQLSK